MVALFHTIHLRVFWLLLLTRNKAREHIHRGKHKWLVSLVLRLPRVRRELREVVVLPLLAKLRVRRALVLQVERVVHQLIMALREVAEPPLNRVLRQRRAHRVHQIMRVLRALVEQVAHQQYRGQMVHRELTGYLIVREQMV